MELNNLVDKVFDIIETKKTVSKLSCTEEDVRLIMKAVQAVNSASAFTNSVGGVRLDQLDLPHWTKPFIYPLKVSILIGFDMKDLVVRPRVDDFVYDEEAIKRAAYRISSSQKAIPEFSKASDLRGDVATLSSVKFAVGQKTKQEGEEVFIPVPLDASLDAVLGEWSNAETDSVIKKYLIRQFNII